MASTIETKINRISDNIAATYAAVEEMGGTVPEAANSDNLPEAVRTIPASGVVIDDTLTISGAAADAKATGDALNQIKSDLENKYTKPSTGIPASDLASGVIPTALKNPNALTFTGAATGTYDGSTPLSINIPQGGGGSGSGGLTQYSTSHVFTQDDCDNFTTGDVFEFYVEMPKNPTMFTIGIYVWGGGLALSTSATIIVPFSPDGGTWLNRMSYSSVIKGDLGSWRSVGCCYTFSGNSDISIYTGSETLDFRNQANSTPGGRLILRLTCTKISPSTKIILNAWA